MRLVGYTGQILSFEPDPASFRQLEAKAAKDGKWKAFNTALGSTAGHLELNLMAEAVYNSFLSPSAAETSADAQSNRVVGKVKVVVDTLGDLLPRLQAEYGFARPHLKMDTQGFDLEVFRGAKAVLGNIVSLQSEVAIKRIYQGSPVWVETIREYQDAGFEVAGLYAVNPHRRELAELDCFMRKSS